MCLSLFAGLFVCLFVKNKYVARLSLTVSYWEIIVILLTDVWPPRQPEATVRSSRSDDIIWDPTTLIWHNPSPSAHCGNIIIHSDTPGLTDWVIQFNVLPDRRAGCYRELNQVILAGPLMGREILCSNQISQQENPLQMCGRTEQNVLYRTLYTERATQLIYLAQVFKQKLLIFQHSSSSSSTYTYISVLYRIGSYYDMW